ncbi:hypothetical protein, partial [Pseudonocardia nigra]|uniref:hypothetical protein n=1 Tax=Pseudonocardia nigra TaxID=1921578 RepID=UPI001C5DE6AF
TSSRSSAPAPCSRPASSLNGPSNTHNPTRPKKSSSTGLDYCSTINRRIRDTQYLLEQAGHTIQPAENPLATLDDLYDLASTAGITIPTRVTTAS